MRSTRAAFRPLTLKPVALKLAAFRDAEDGVAAIEFALILTLILLPLWLGFAEVAKMHERSTTMLSTTTTVADMVSAYPKITQAQLSDVLEAAAYTVGADAGRKRGDGTSMMNMMVKGVVVPKQGSTTPPYVAWSMDNDGRSTCQLGDALPARIAERGPAERFLIVVEGKLSYKTNLDWNRSGYQSTKHRAYFSPRLAASVSGPNPCPKPA